MEFTIDRMRETDWNQVRAIYQEGIATGNATFETEAPTWERWHEAHQPACRLVASLFLFRRYGFREIGFRERIGRHHNIWRDVLLLERRSTVVGTE